MPQGRFFQYPCRFVVSLSGQALRPAKAFPAFDTAKVAELVDALDLGSSGATRESSSLSFRTIPFQESQYRRRAARPDVTVQEQQCKSS